MNKNNKRINLLSTELTCNNKIICFAVVVILHGKISLLYPLILILHPHQNSIELLFYLIPKLTEWKVIIHVKIN